METKTLSQEALNTIESYLHFSNGTVDIPIPYFNNRRSQIRHGLRSLIGKGSINDILEELQLIAFREKRDLATMSADDFKKYLVSHNIGIDCSGFAYYILDNETKARKYGTLRSHISHPYKNIIGKLISRFARSVENINVATLAHPANSNIIPLRDVQPGDFITMINTAEPKYNHVILVYKVEYVDGLPRTIYYSHSMAWPTDGEYNHGVRQGRIDITDITQPVSEQHWVEQEKTGEENYTYMRAHKAHSELRRLKWFCN